MEGTPGQASEKAKSRTDQHDRGSVMEILICFCDFCNPHQSTHGRDGRGYLMCPEEVAASDFDWKRMPDGKIMCTECQDETEESQTSKEGL